MNQYLAVIVGVVVVVVVVVVKQNVHVPKNKVHYFYIYRT